jgi:hypothetical protein
VGGETVPDFFERGSANYVKTKTTPGTAYLSGSDSPCGALELRRQHASTHDGEISRLGRRCVLGVLPRQFGEVHPRLSDSDEGFCFLACCANASGIIGVRDPEQNVLEQASVASV